jgi:hypothetical protein
MEHCGFRILMTTVKLKYAISRRPTHFQSAVVISPTIFPEIGIGYTLKKGKFRALLEVV